jgi:ABC-2 type transport system ATP-binding protein
MEDALLSIDGFSKHYGKKSAVDNLSLHIRQGEVFGFLGPNGAGKTTTMKCCAGLLRPTAGTIHINGNDIVRQSLLAKPDLGYVPDQPFLYNKLTGREFVQFVTRLYKTETRSQNETIEEFFTLFEMEESQHDLIQSYSRGMRQKTALIAALAHQPKLLLVDEPTANLDPRSARLVKDIFRSMASQGKAVFISTHVMEIAEHLCDRIAIIHQGRLVASGTMEELRSLGSKGGSLEDLFLNLTGAHDEETMKRVKALSAKEG